MISFRLPEQESRFRRLLSEVKLNCKVYREAGKTVIALRPASVAEMVAARDKNPLKYGMLGEPFPAIVVWLNALPTNYIRFEHYD